MKLPIILLAALLSAGLTEAASAAGTSPVSSRTPEIKVGTTAANNEILLKFAPGMDEARARSFLRSQGLSARTVFRNLSKSTGMVYLSAAPASSYRAPARGTKVQMLAQALASSSAAGRTSATDGAKVQKLAQALEATPQVDSASPNYVVQAVGNSLSNQPLPPAPRRDQAQASEVPAATPNDPRLGELWGMQNIEAQTAWNSGTGSENVVVFVIDTGIDTDHPDLVGNLWSNPGEVPGDGLDNDGNGRVDDVHGIDTVNGDSNPEDDHGHGTHCAGTIGAQGNNGVGVVGVNWDVRIGACKFLAANGSGSTAGAVSCLDYVLGLKNAGVNVVATNNSWGGGGYSEPLQDVLEANIAAGILPIIAAGNSTNDNDASPSYPCSYEFPGATGDSLCVAAIDSGNNLAGFSNYGANSVDLGAPGVGILSSVPGLVDPSLYASWSGTSMATPHVTGMAALIASVKPGSSLTAIRNAILCSTVATNALTDKVATDGRANVLLALQADGGECAQLPLSVVLTAPAEHETVVGSVAVSADAASAAGIAQVEFFVDEASIGVDSTAPYSVVWNASAASSDLHVVKAVATDANGNIANDESNVYVTSGLSGKALVLDLGSTNDSCDLVGAALARNNATPVHAASIGSMDPAEHPMAFVCLGYDLGSKHVLTEEESALLAAYLDNGGRLYMEGGDTWAWDADRPVHDYFGILGIADGTADLATVNGLDGGLAQGIGFGSAGASAYVDHLEPTNGGVAIWENVSPAYIVGVSRQTETYRTIGTSFEFGNIPDKSTQTQTMAAYLAFFGAAVPPVQTVIDFEEAGTPSAEIADGYKGLNWDNCYAVEPSNYFAGASGYENGITSGTYVGYNGFAEPCTISSPEPVRFKGGNFTGAWNNGLTVTAQGYIGGMPTGVVSVVVNYDGPTWFDLSSLGEIDTLVLSSAGGIDVDPNDPGAGEHFAMDDLELKNSAPIPAKATGVAAIRKLSASKDFARIDLTGMTELGEAAEASAALHFQIGTEGGGPAWSFDVAGEDVETDGETLHYLDSNKEVTCYIADERCLVKAWNVDMAEGNISEEMSVVLKVGAQEYIGIDTWDKKDSSESTIYKKK